MMNKTEKKKKKIWKRNVILYALSILYNIDSNNVDDNDGENDDNPLN